MIRDAVDLELARHQWAEGRRAVDRSRSDRKEHSRLSTRVELVVTELSGRVGQVFTLQELADAYGASERWVFETVHDSFPDEAPVSSSVVAAAAFDQYARRASDYTP